MTGASEPDAPIVLLVPESLGRERLDRVLLALLPEHSRGTLQRWISDGRVLADGRALRSSARVPAGARIEVRPAPPPPSAASPEDIPLSVLYEDAHIVVIDKPAGLVVHPAAGHATGTLVNALLHHFSGALPGDAMRPGIVHRLDKDTSGVMVVARTETAREALLAQFARHDLERSYLAIAQGHAPASVTYDTLHGRHPTDRKRFSGRVVRGRRAVTHVERLEDLRGATLLRCRLETGRTHQIRVHLSEAGFPILGDPLYGGAPRDPRLRAVAKALRRQALHAAVLGLRHPETGAAMRFETPLPPDMAEALEVLRAGA